MAMDKAWFSIFVVTTMVILTEMASIETISSTARVDVIKPKHNESEEEVKRISSDSSDEEESNLLIELDYLNNTVHNNESSENTEIAVKPSVFVLERDPINPVFCYSGKSINIKTNSKDELEISFLKDVSMNNTTSRINKKFIWSSDPLYPVLCQKVNIASNSINNGTAEEENSTISNATCIRRDYDQNISAIFINNVGPIQSAWNIFNSTTTYEYFNIEYSENMGEIRTLNDTLVDCEEYGLIAYDQKEVGVTYVLSSGAVASLLGG